MFEAAVRAEADVCLAGVTADPAELVGAMRDLRAGFVIAGVRRSGLPPGCAAALEEFPTLVFVGVDVELGYAYVHAAGRPVRMVGDVSPARLVKVIRDMEDHGESHPG
ncbi:MAG TPA: hypothetical protein VI300_00580 [Solirubrobacter sp.]